MKLKLLFGLLILLTASTSAAGLGSIFGQDDSGNAALVQLSGSITPTSSGFGAQGLTPEAVRTINQEVSAGEYDAVIYEINSGGGAVVASKEIKRSIESMEIPTVCRFRDISASGAYLIATGCDRIVADSATITGSVGVTSSYLEYSGTLNKLGIDYVNVTAGEYKEVGSMYTNATDEEKKILKDMALDIQDEFVGLVDENRNLTESQLSEVQTAKLFLGDEAKNLSLVDKLGGRQTSLTTAEELTDKDLQIRKVQSRQSPSLLSLFLSETGISQVMSNIGVGANSNIPLVAEYR